MAKEKAGLYLGEGSVGVALKDKKNLLALSSSGLSSIAADEVESLDENLRWQALIRKNLRQAKADVSQVYLALADRDFIIRSLVMPLMKKKEIESSLIYEIEKYIPFKPEELIWDYQYMRFPKEKKIAVSFVGIRKHHFIQVNETLANLELKPLAIEPACLSLARLFKSEKSFKKIKNFALLDLTAQEAYLTFFQNDLPVFNRYLNIKKKEGKLDIDNFSEAISFSFRYFRREFKEYSLDKMFVLSSLPKADDLAALLAKSLSLDTKNISPYDLTSRKESCVESLKALGAVGRDDYPYKFKPVLRQAQEAEAEKTIYAARVGWRWLLLAGTGAAALLVYFATFFFLGKHLSFEKKYLKNKEQAISLPAGLKEAGWQNIDEVIGRQRDLIKELKQADSGQLRFSQFLNAFLNEGFLPDKMWLDSLRLSQTGREGFVVTIRGYIYRDDDYQERIGINDFISNLRERSSVNSLFSEIELESTNRKKIRDFIVTEFSLKLKQGQGR